MAYRSLRLFALLAILGFAAAGAASAQDCSGTITADQAMKAETARYAAQTSNDFAVMEKLFGNDLTYNYSSAATGQDRTVPLRFTALWAKRPSGLEFVSWQSTGISPRP